MNFHQRKQVQYYRRKDWKKTIWIASKLESEFDDYGNEITKYAKPIKYEFNVQPVSSESDIEEFGENAKQMQKAVISRKEYEGKFKEFDIAYLDGASPLDDGGEIILNVKDLNNAKISLVNNLKVSNLSNEQTERYQCLNANYVLYPPRNQNKAIVIYFKRLTAK